MPNLHANAAVPNVFTMPSYGKAISLDDQGVYYTLNHQTGQIHSVFQLVYSDDWYLYQLQKTSVDDEVSWNLMAATVNSALLSMTSEEINHHFSRPEYAEPKGAWQVIRNAHFGFAKFTPVEGRATLKFAMLIFKDGQMQMPVLIHKVEEQVQSPEQSLLSLA